MKRTYILALTLTLLAVPPAWPAPGRAPVGDDVVATVNNEPIPRETLVKRLIARYGANDLERMINQALVRQAAELQKVTVTDKEVEDQGAQIRSVMRTPERFRQWLQQAGLTEALYREQERYKLLTEKIVLKQNPIVDAELEHVRARSIVVSTEAAAQEVLRAAKQGTDFGELAKEKSTDQFTGQRLGGLLLPRFPAGDLIPPSATNRLSLMIMRVDYPEVWAALSKLKPGETSGPVKVRQNFAVLKLEERVAPSALTPSEQTNARARLLDYRSAALVEGLRKQGKILYPVPLNIDAATTQSGASAAAVLRASPQSDIVASVNGEAIPRAALVKRLLAYYGPRTLEMLIERVLVRQAADRAKITVTDKEVEDQVNRIRSTEATTFQQWLAVNGLTEPLYREEWRYTLLSQKLAEHQNPVKDSDLDQIRTRLILVQTEAEAQEVRRTLRRGTDFAQVAKEKSIDKTTGQMGGMLPDMMQVDRTDIWQAVAGLKPGEISSPIKLGPNYAVVKLEARIPASTLGEQERKARRQRVLRYRIDATVEALRKQAKIAYPTPL